LKTEVV